MTYRENYPINMLGAKNYDFTTYIFLGYSSRSFSHTLAFRVRSKKFLLGVPIFIFCMPILFGISLYVLRAPIQQGVFLTNFGPILSMFFPADDLYSPLAEESLSPEKNTYNFNLSHKYLGNHAVFIEVPSDVRPEFVIERSLNLMVQMKEGDKVLFSGSSDRGSPYSGKSKYGFYYIGYKVPENVPVSKDIAIEINIEKDIRSFLKNHENAKVIVRKKSDQ